MRSMAVLLQTCLKVFLMRVPRKVAFLDYRDRYHVLDSDF